jgi:phospholipase/carboxylesterase
VELLRFGPLRVRRLVKGDLTSGKNTESAPLTCILLHGFGAPGDDLVGLVSGMDVPDGTVFFFPEALHSLQDFISDPGLGDARAWWMIDITAMQRAMLTGQLRDLSAQVPDGLADARAAITEMLDAMAKTYSWSEEEDRRVVLGGFSQGAMLSLDVALRDPSRKLSGVVILSGTLIAEHEWTSLFPKRKGMPVFQTHGTSDPILPFEIAERLRDAMKSAGVDVTFESFAGPHTISPRVLSKLSAWLRDATIHKQ